MKNFSNSYQKFVFGLEQINQAAQTQPVDFINDIESTYREEVSCAAEKIFKSGLKGKVVMLSGPSGSGKTTTAHMIKEELTRLGSGAVIISLDDFYRDRNKCPVLHNGDFDFESLDALDVNEIQKCISSLLEDNFCDMPKFDFIEKKPSKEKTRVQLNKGEIAIIEGIHGLNPVFTKGIPEDAIIRIYISVKQGICDYNGQIISNRSIRLARRLVRDYYKRKSDPQVTLSMWDNVCKGQATYIYPFKRTSDITINSIHIYEPCVLRNMAISLLSTVPESSGSFRESLKLISALERFYPINQNLVPLNSMIREFIGGGIYEC